jgi:hypothetical protein
VVSTESLTLAASAVFADLSQGERLAKEIAIEEHSSFPKAYVHRMTRQIKDLERLPLWLQELPERIFGGLIGRETAAVSATTNADAFGFHKTVVVATKNGRLIGIDTAAGGNVSWNVPVPNYANNYEWQVPVVKPTPHGTIRVKNASGHWVFETSTGKLLRAGTDAAKTKFSTGTVVRYDLVDGDLVGYLNQEKKLRFGHSNPKLENASLIFRPDPLRILLRLSERC